MLQRQGHFSPVLLAVIALAMHTSACRSETPQAAENPTASPSQTPAEALQAAEVHPDMVVQTAQVEVEQRAGHRPLGAPPLCEASDALNFELPGVTPGVVVVDNEIHDTLFVFDDVDGQLVNMRAVDMPAKHHPRDMEAIAQGRPGTFVVMGSHSRNSSCQVKSKRRRAGTLEFAGETLNWAHVKQPHFDHGDAWSFADDDCAAAYFGQHVAGATAFCAATATAERTATAQRCNTINIEGAAAINGAIWLGLRSPLVDGKAPLLAWTAKGEQFHFEQLRLLDLDGAGIRGILRRKHDVLIIGGPPTDDDPVPFGLWRVKRTEFPTTTDETPPVEPAWDQPPETLTAQRIDLPADVDLTHAEGMVESGTGVIFVFDGAEGDDDDRCDIPATQLFVDLVDLAPDVD